MQRRRNWRLPEARLLEARLNREAGGFRGGSGHKWWGGRRRKEKLTGEEGERSIKNLSVHNTKCQGL